MQGFQSFPRELAAGVRMLVLDIDGVMTAGEVIMGDSGAETKAFNVRDGHGIKLLQRAGIQLAILTGRKSEVVAHRARDLGIEYVVQGSLRKVDGLAEIARASGIAPTDCAYMGDDVIDLPPMRMCCLTMAPQDAHPSVQAQVHWVADYCGGAGAVRQACEGLILANDQWDTVLTGPYGVSPQECLWPEG